MKSLSQRELKELLDYDPETGVFRWKHSKGRARKGSIAGNVCRTLGYVFIRIDGTLYRAHRLAWLYIHGRWPNDELDHRNHHRNDNRLNNLREADRIGNGRNLPKKKNNTSGITGVYWDRRRNKWYAQIYMGRAIYLGIFSNKEDAIRARRSAEIEYGFHENHGRVA